MSESAPAVSSGSRGLFTPFNIVTGLILAVGAYITVLRFSQGLAATTNLTHLYPWGLWIGFDVMAGVALAAGGFVTSTAVYVFGLKEYKPVVRPAILTGFLGYFLVVVGLLFDLGQPWRLPYPFLVQAGPSSALFEIALCVALYLSTLFVEFSPAAFEWLGWKRWRKLVHSMTLALTIFGLILSTLHQSTLGAMFLSMPTRLHPLWWSPYIPVHFFVSAVAAGLGMVLIEGYLSHRYMAHKVEISHAQFDRITYGLGKAAAVVLAIYLATKVMGITLEHKWHYLSGGYGALYLTELLGFVVLPLLMFVIGYRERRTPLIRWAAVLTVIGIVFNRLNVAIFAYNYYLPAEERYVPSWMEVWISLSIVTAGVVAFRWIASRMPILSEHPAWRGH